MQPLVCQRYSAVVEAVRLFAACLALVLLCVPPGHSAVASPTTADSGSGVAVRGVLIPTGFQDRKYSAVIQIAVDGSPLPGATWEFAASFVSADQATEDFAGRIVAEKPDTPVAFEFQVKFDPGLYALTLEARETTTGQSGTRKLAGRWPDPNAERSTVSPVVLLQPAQGTFMRGENARGQGALALGDDDPVRTQLPTAIVSVVCRGRGVRELVRVQRRLEGASSIDFNTIDLQPDHDQCAQVRDVIPSGSLGAGNFKYRVHVITATGEFVSGVREFSTVGGAQRSRPGC